ncbi:MAG: DUF4124 domain-containing protein [Comamonadaceae bacterium]|nr:DUF4124 domain-containing protein [Comamonadaceae bacterium]
MHVTSIQTLAAVGLISFAVAVHAQTLPPPSRTVYKCDSGGKAVYSDSPCLGAERIDVQPTRGLSKLSGNERIGADVSNEKWTEMLAEALRPLLGESPEQFAVRRRRVQLTPVEQQQCYGLDRRIGAVEQDERRANRSELSIVQQELPELRTRYRQLRC